MQQMNPTQELQLLDSTLNFLSRSQISGGESERMSEVKGFLVNRMQQIQAMMQQQAQPPQPPAQEPKKSD
jgi:hypothetical protein